MRLTCFAMSFTIKFQRCLGTNNMIKTLPVHYYTLPYSNICQKRARVMNYFYIVIILYIWKLRNLNITSTNITSAETKNENAGRIHREGLTSRTQQVIHITSTASQVIPVACDVYRTWVVVCHRSMRCVAYLTTRICFGINPIPKLFGFTRRSRLRD